MPNCFTLTRKGADKPTNLVEIDEEMCKHFNEPVHPTQWFRAWYDIEGFGLAMGKTWEWMRENLPERKEVIDFLEANYDANAWYQHK